MSALDGAGLEGNDISLVAEALQNYITGAQQSARDARDAETRSGITDEQWIELLRPVLEEHFDPATYPALARMGEARREKAPVSHSERTARFEFGLERMLDGLEAYIRERHP